MEIERDDEVLVEKKEKTFEEMLVDIKNVVLPINRVMIATPFHQERTSNGVWKAPEGTMTEDTINERWARWHKVLLVSSNISDIKVGDYIWLTQKSFIPTTVDMDGTPYIVAEHYMIGAIKREETTNGL